MKAINRRTGKEITVRKFRNDERNSRKRTRWTREGSLRALNESYANERESEES